MGSMLPKARHSRHAKGQADHADAWLMSYADLITLLFMLFVIFVSVSVSRNSHTPGTASGEPEHPYGQHKSGILALGTQFDEAYRALTGVVLSSHADQAIALEKTSHGIVIDMSAIAFFDEGSDSIPTAQMPLLQELARTLKGYMVDNASIEVEGHTSGDGMQGSQPGNGWTLAALRAVRVVGVLQDAGIAPSKLRATSYAGTQPLVPNRDAAGRAIARNQQRNQRIVIRLQAIPEAN